jgi:hypothetical protein
MEETLPRSSLTGNGFPDGSESHRFRPLLHILLFGGKAHRVPAERPHRAPPALAIRADGLGGSLGEAPFLPASPGPPRTTVASSPSAPLAVTGDAGHGRAGRGPLSASLGGGRSRP